MLPLAIVPIAAAVFSITCFKLTGIIVTSSAEFLKFFHNPQCLFQLLNKASIVFDFFRLLILLLASKIMDVKLHNLNACTLASFNQKRYE